MTTAAASPTWVELNRPELAARRELSRRWWMQDPAMGCEAIAERHGIGVESARNDLFIGGIPPRLIRERDADLAAGRRARLPWMPRDPGPPPSGLVRLESGCVVVERFGDRARLVRGYAALRRWRVQQLEAAGIPIPADVTITPDCRRSRTCVAVEHLMFRSRAQHFAILCTLAQAELRAELEAHERERPR
jgi:hypothetical protein